MDALIKLILFVISFKAYGSCDKGVYDYGRNDYVCPGDIAEELRKEEEAIKKANSKEEDEEEDKKEEEKEES